MEQNMELFILLVALQKKVAKEKFPDISKILQWKVLQISQFSNYMV